MIGQSASLIDRLRAASRAAMLVLLLAAIALPVRAQDEIFHRWNDIALKQVRDTLMGPPMVARMFAAPTGFALWTIGFARGQIPCSAIHLTRSYPVIRWRQVEVTTL